MIIPRIIEMAETTDGGLYVVVEFRNGSGSVVCTEDFVWRTYPTSVTELDIDRYGRVMIGGDRVFPYTPAGVLRTDLDQAITFDRAKDQQEITDEVLYEVLKFRDRFLEDESSPLMSGDNRMDAGSRPGLRRRARAAALRNSITANIGNDVLGDVEVLRNRVTERAVGRERARRQR